MTYFKHQLIEQQPHKCQPQTQVRDPWSQGQPILSRKKYNSIIIVFFEHVHNALPKFWIMKNTQLRPSWESKSRKADSNVAGVRCQNWPFPAMLEDVGMVAMNGRIFFFKIYIYIYYLFFPRTGDLISSWWDAALIQGPPEVSGSFAIKTPFQDGLWSG
jgi:hypothetical protein